MHPKQPKPRVGRHEALRHGVRLMREVINGRQRQLEVIRGDSGGEGA